MIHHKLTIIVIIISGLFAKVSDRFQLQPLDSTNSKIIFTQEQLQYQNRNGFQEILSKSSATTQESGMPKLPMHTFLYEIPSNSHAQVSYMVVQSHFESGKRIIPFQSVGLGEAETGHHPPAINSTFYQSPGIFPSENLRVSEPQIMRDIQVVSISLVPFIYKPRTDALEVFDEVEILITTTYNQGYEERYQSAPVSGSFQSVYQNTVINYDEFREVGNTPVILYICGGYSISSPYIQSLFNWRHQRGYKVHSVSTSTTGTTTTAIKNYIQNQYDSPASRPDFVCLIGDAGGSFNIPTFMENYSGYGGEGDHPYTQLSGNDLLSDIFIGRLPVRSTTDISVVVNKIINYEKGIDLGSNWTEKAALIGDPSYSGISCAITMEYVADIMEEFGMADIRLKTTGSNYATWMQSQLNEGVLYFNYRGYYGVSGFTSSHVDGANNGFKLPFATVITCGTGSFASESVSLAEKFMVAGTVANPKGAIASIGTATTGTHTLFNNIFDMGIYQGLFVDGDETTGEALVSGKIYLYQNYPANPENYVSIFTHWNNLMGDPSTHIWTDTPVGLVVEHPTTLNWGESLIAVHVTTDTGTPVENARVTLLKGNDEIFLNLVTDASGFVHIPIQFASGGDIAITVTRKNAVPYIGTISIPLSGPHLTLHEQEITFTDDGSSGTIGDGDSNVNPGETFIIRLPIYNTGTDEITGLDCQLSFLSENVEVLSDNVIIPLMISDDHATPEFLCALSPGAVDRELLNGMMTINSIDMGSWVYSVPINVFGSRLSFNVITVSGNDDGHLTPGQTDTLWVSMTNSGSRSISEVSAILNVNGDFIIPLENDLYWDHLESGESAYSVNPLILEVDNDIINGSVLNLNFIITSTDGYDQPAVIEIIAGELSVNDPMGPDEYGYYIYDSGDTGYDLAPVYDWIEIDPHLGGSGTELSIDDGGNNQDDSQVLTLPFNFRFYGDDYSQITVCSNGWIALGESPMESFRNYTIPGPGGPSPMIAVFWDDLKTTNNNKIYSYYHTTIDAFIIEWSGVRTYDQNSSESFQAILYNNMMPPFGDNEIKLQYMDFNNTSVGNYGSYNTPVHGDYCTIGIENPTANVGLQYTFNNTYPLPAMQLGDETALFITTRLAQSLPVPALTISQTDMNFELQPDQTQNDIFTITNSGEPGSTLYYTAELLPIPYPAGNPDSFGHYWSDSDMDVTADYSWIDISETGSIIEFSHNDVASGPVDIGFDFPFYGEYYYQCIISPNGWIGFGEDNTEWQNSSIPNADAPRPAIFPFWDDLNPVNDSNSPSMEGTVYYENTGDVFVIWFDHVAHWDGQIQGNYNFQAILYPSGDIHFNYSDLDGVINRSTIGIQNGDGTDGIQIVMDDDYVHENLSTFIKPSPAWVELFSDSGELTGSLQNSEFATITVMVNSAGLSEGNYTSVLKLATNVQPPVIVPIILAVSDTVPGDGDINQDNIINVVDIVLMVNIIIGEILPDEYQFWAADLNGDGLVDVLDIVDIIEIILEQ